MLMPLLRGICLPLALVALPTVVASAADIVNVRSSKQRPAGEIVAVSKTALTIKPIAGDNIEVPANDVISVEYEDAPADFRLALSDETAGRLTEALDRLSKVKAANVEDKNIQADVAYAQGRVQARRALVDAAEQQAAIDQLTAAQKAFPDFYRYYESMNYLGQVQLARKDFAAARTAFDELSQAPFPDFKLAGKIASARILMGEGNTAGAIDGFRDVINTAGQQPVEQARRFEAMLGLARGLMLEGKHEEALTTLREVTRNGPADEAPLQAEAYTLQGTCLENLGRTKEAVLAFLHVDVLFPGESGYHAESLYHLSRLWKAVQLPERSLDAQAKLESKYANSEWVKKLSAN